jgi:hypothetical protein
MAKKKRPNPIGTRLNEELSVSNNDIVGLLGFTYTVTKVPAG